MCKWMQRFCHKWISKAVCRLSSMIGDEIIPIRCKICLQTNWIGSGQPTLLLRPQHIVVVKQLYFKAVIRCWRFRSQVRVIICLEKRKTMEKTYFCEVFVKRMIVFVGFNIIYLIICSVSYVWFKIIELQ